MKKNVILLSIIFIIIGCSGANSSSTDDTTEIYKPEDIGGLNLQEIEGSTEIDNNSFFLYIFENEISSTTVNSSTFFMVEQQTSESNALKGLFDESACLPNNAIPSKIECYNHLYCTLKPSNPLNESTNHIVCLSRDIKYSDGSSFEPIQFSFKTKTVSELEETPDEEGNNDDDNQGNNEQESSYPSCNDSYTFFDSPPTSLDSLEMIIPLGKLNPRSGHVFPTDHIYLIPHKDGEGNNLSQNVYSPGDIIITSISRSTYWTGNTDYTIDFTVCEEVVGAFGHVLTISDSLFSLLNFDEDNCFSFSMDAIHETISCRSDINITVNSGDLLGTAKNFDFFLYDQRSSMNIINDEYAAYDILNESGHSVCPIDYYSTELKSQLENLIGNTVFGDDFVPRTNDPICGTIDQDIPNTAQGRWFYQDFSVHDEIYHLSLVKDHVLPDSYQKFGTGNQLTGVDVDIYNFRPLSSGTVNRDFTDVTNDDQIYCYEVFFTEEAGTLFTLIIQMTSDTTLRIEAKEATECTESSYTFTEGNYVDYHR